MSGEGAWAVARWLSDGPPEPAVLAADLEALGAAVAALDLIESLAPDDPDGALDLLEGLVEDALTSMPGGRRSAFVADQGSCGPRAASLLAPFAAATTADGRVAALLAGEFDPEASDGDWAADAAETMAGLIDELAVDGGAALVAEAWLLDPLLAAVEATGADPAGPVGAAQHRAGPPLIVGRVTAHDPTPLEAIPMEGPPGLPPVARRRSHAGWWVAALAAAAVVAALALRSTPETPPTIPVGVTAHGTPPTTTDPDVPPTIRPATPLRPALVPIPAGTAELGSPAGEPGRQTDETRRRVTLTRAFWMARTEVTQGQWRSLLGTTPARFGAAAGGGDAHPVEQVSWHDAAAYANALSAAEGRAACYRLADCAGEPGDGRFTCAAVTFEGLDCGGYRLPTEAEWEYAARGGTATATYAGPFVLRGDRDAPALEDIAWYSGNSGVARGGVACGDWTGRPPGVVATACGTHPVATKAANPWGLHDMLGNVWEWTTDGHGALPATPQTDPVVAPAERMVTKGCGWFREARFCRAANRYRPRPDYRAWVLGVRVVRTMDR